LRRAVKFAEHVVSDCPFPDLVASMRYFLIMAKDKKNHTGILDEVVDWLEELPRPSGRGGNIKLYPWQIILCCYLFEFQNAKKETVVIIPRKNGKTTIVAALGLAAMKYSPDLSAEVCCFATKAEQARLVFDAASRIVLRAGENGLEDFQTLQHIMYYDRQKKNSTLRAYASESKTLDGLNPSLAIVDESALVSSDIQAVISSSFSEARDWQKLIHITTANRDPDCYIRELSRNALRELEFNRTPAINPVLFQPPWELENQPAADDPAAWRWLNPAWGEIITEQGIRSDWEKAKGIISAENEFKTKRLNIWAVPAQDALFSIEIIEGFMADFNDEVFENNEVTIGLDLAYSHDTTAVAFLTRDAASGNYYVKVKQFICEQSFRDKVERHALEVMRDFEHSGDCVISGDTTIDYAPVEKLLREACDNWYVTSLVTDRMTRGLSVSDLIAKDLPLKPTFMTLTKNVKTPVINLFVESATNKKLILKRNRMAKWEMSRASLRVFPDGAKDIVRGWSDKHTQTIDSVYAMLYALAPWVDRDYQSVASGEATDTSADLMINF